MTRVLISGASIAGPALAMWLTRAGWDCTVVEQAPRLRSAGQNIDVRGAAREVLRRAGLEETVRAATTGELGTRFIGDAGEVIAEFPAGTSDTEGATAEVEILRGDLAQILVDASTESNAPADYIFGDRITALDNDGDSVRVEFANREAQTFDFVVAADGMRSSTRRMVFGREVRVRPLGMEMTYLTIPRSANDTDWWRWHNAPGGLAVTLRPDRHGTTRAVLTSSRPRRDGAAIRSDYLTRRTDEQVEQELRDRFADVGWEAQRILDELDSVEEVYHDSIAQVDAPRWSSGRIILLGDSAWCASPVSGMGTSLSLVGAYVLAGELTSGQEPQHALQNYERIMRPYVDVAQKLPPGVPQVANPQSKFGIGVFRLALRAAGSPLARKLGAALVSPPADDIDLPDYPQLALGH